MLRQPTLYVAEPIEYDSSSPWLLALIDTSRKEVTLTKEGKREGSKNNPHREKLPDLGGRGGPEGWLQRGARKAGCFGARVLIMRNFLMTVKS